MYFSQCNMVILGIDETSRNCFPQNTFHAINELLFLTRE